MSVRQLLLAEHADSQCRSGSCGTSERVVLWWVGCHPSRLFASRYEGRSGVTDAYVLVKSSAK